MQLQINGVYRHVVAQQLPDGSFERVERIVRVQEVLDPADGDWALVCPATLAYFTPRWLSDASEVLEALEAPEPMYRHREGLVTFA
jgi:hypothetical protein